MNVPAQQQLKAAITSNLPLEQVVDLLRRFREQGVSQGEVYSFLQAWHRAAPDEATDDRILEVAGFCAAHMKIWDATSDARLVHKL